MANISSLPKELLDPIIRHLRDRKIDHFDPVANKDLQTVRLVCSKWSAIATPMLFENMVLDLKFGQIEDADKWMVHFATTNPELAKHVHRLQLRVPSIISDTAFDGTSRLSQALEAWGFSRSANVGGIVIGSPAQLWADRLARIGIGKALWDPSWTIRGTNARLPNLKHWENAMSAYYRKYLAETGARCRGNERINLLEICQETEHDRALMFLKGVQEIISQMADTITSPNPRRVLAIDAHAISNFPENLEHLDLDLQLSWTLGKNRSPAFKRFLIGEWRKTLKVLAQLKSLRLAFACGRDRYADEHMREPPLKNSDRLCIDDLLISPLENADPCYFAHLTSLRLVICSLRVHGLQIIASRHNETLRELELSRVTFDTLYCAGSWSEIGAMCHEALPNLKYLRLAKLITYLPNLGLEGEPEREPVPNRWIGGLEGAMSYEWIKNGRGSGADLEMIGPSAPGLDDQGKSIEMRMLNVFPLR